MKENDLISIVIPVYNVAPYLKKNLESVISQTYSNLEIILVDDGSIDESGNICEQFACGDKRIVVVHKENGGLSDARNAGITIARGKYITFIDSDDYISNDYIEHLYDLLIENDAQISIARLIKTSDENCGVREEKTEIEVLNNKEAIGEMLYARKFSTSACVKLYLTELFDDIRYPYQKFSEDMFTTYKLLNKADKIVYSSQICYYYLRREGSIIVSQFAEKHMDVVEALMQLKEEIPLIEYGIEKAYASQMVECIAAMFERKPSVKEIRRLGLWDIFLKYRKTVLWDGRAPKRVRGYALLSYLGLHATIFVINKYYNYKWRNKHS